MSKADPIDVSIIVVSYNTSSLTLESLRSVISESKNLNYELLVIDNNSTDDSVANIERYCPKAEVISLSKNIGFAAANNLAATKAQGRYLLLLNPDTVVKNNAIERLLSFAKTYPNAKIWGGRTIFPDGTLNPTSCWSRMTLWNTFCRATGLTGLLPTSEFFNAESYGRWQRDCIRQVDIVSGCFFLITRDLWDHLGGFDPAFFMYGEEADLCLRARNFGALPMITPEATIVHLGGASEKTQAGKLIKLLSAKATLIQRHFPARQISLAISFLMAWPLTRSLAFQFLAKLLRRQSLQQKADTWQKVWQQRAHWARGWQLDENVTPAPVANGVIASSSRPG